MNHALLEPLFQPIFDRGGAVFALEALLRFKGRDIDPARIIRRLERTGGIVALDLAMVRRIGEQLAENGTRPRIAVNVSIRTVQEAGQAFVAALQAIEPLTSLLIVELTETVPVTDFHAFGRFCDDCRDKGFALALDDCKPGHLYAAPAFVSNLRPQFVKLDGLFLQTSHQQSNPKDLRQIIRGALRLQAPVIAEHVSTPALRDYVFQLGADYAQGFELGRPAPLPATKGSVYTYPISNSISQDRP